MVFDFLEEVEVVVDVFEEGWVVFVKVVEEVFVVGFDELGDWNLCDFVEFCD